MRCATTVSLDLHPLILDIGTADRTQLGRTVEGVLADYEVAVSRREVVAGDGPGGLIDRFHLTLANQAAEFPAGHRLAIQVALLEALDPELRWVANELAELYPDEH